MDSSLADFVLSKGGPVALVAAFGFALKYGVDFVVTWRKGRRADSESRPSPVADAAATNAMLLESLEATQAASRRKDERIDELEAEVEALRDEQWELKREYEEQLGELRSKVQDVTLQLEALQARIGSTFH